MSRMSVIKNFLKHYWLLVFLGLIAISLLIIRLTYHQQPIPVSPASPTQKETLNSPKIDGYALPKDVQSNFSEFPSAPQLSIYQGQKEVISEDQAKKTAQVFSFSDTPQVTDNVNSGKFYIWNTKTNFLSIAFKTGEVRYGTYFNQTKPASKGIFPSQSQAENSLKNLVTKLDLKFQFDFKWQKPVYLQTRGFDFITTDDYLTANFIEVGFNPRIGDYQLVGYDPQGSLVSAFLDGNNEIVQFQSENYFSNFEEKETYDLKSNNEVQSELTTEGKIVYVGNQEATGKQPEISKVVFEQISLAYFQEAEINPLIQPIYILSGQGTLKDGSQTEVVAYLPAIASKWLKKTTTQEHFQIKGFNLPTGGFGF